MNAQFSALLNRLAQQVGTPAAVLSATCPDDIRQIIPKLLDIGASPTALTSALSELFSYPVYDSEVHGDFQYQGCDWAFADNILFLACPFDPSLQPAAVLPDEARSRCRGFGILPLQIHDEDQSAPSDDRAQAKRMIDRWLEQAIQHAATDLHIAPLSSNYLRVRMRVDGRLQTMDEIPMQSEQINYLFISNTLLHLAGCQTGNFIKPVDGRFIHRRANGNVEVRLAMHPVSVYGVNSQAFYLRLLSLHGGKDVLTIEQLGLPDEVEQTFAMVCRMQHGLVLMTGPTGSGKSTSLYAHLLQIAKEAPWRSIQTLEDPVEHNIKGIEQTQINEAVGMSFHQGLRSLIRSDVDVILVGEVRDSQTARLAVRASLTGHLVFATVHAKDALSAIERMIDLEVSPQSLALVLVVVFAQRLLRTVCRRCSSSIRFADCQPMTGHALLPAEQSLRLASKDGCEHCLMGYHGRHAVIEYIRVSSKLAAAISAGGSYTALRTAAMASPHLFLWPSAVFLLQQGLTTLDECERQLPLYDDQDAAVCSKSSLKRRRDLPQIIETNGGRTAV